MIAGGLSGLAWYVNRSEPAPQPKSRLTKIVPEATSTVAVPDTAPAITARSKPKPGEIEICGLGIFNEADIQDQGLDKAYEAQIRQAFEAIRKRLRASAVEQDRVAGLLLEVAQTRIDETVSAYEAGEEHCEDNSGQNKPVRSQACSAAKAAFEDSERRRDQRAASLVKEIAETAFRLQDPAIYAPALDVCGSLRAAERPASCAKLSAAGWARLQPENTTPWLHVLEEAQGRKDANGVADALHHLSLAKQSKAQPVWLIGKLFDAADPDSDIEVTATIVSSVTVLALHGFPPYQTLSKHCAVTALTDANRWQVCDAIAHTLVSQSDTAIGTLIGIGVGKRLGWDVENTTAMTNETRALSMALTNLPDSNGSEATGFMSCAGIRLLDQRLRLGRERGELQAARHLVQASGKTVQQVTQEFVKGQQHDALARAASAPASGPARQ